MVNDIKSANERRYRMKAKFYQGDRVIVVNAGLRYNQWHELAEEMGYPDAINFYPFNNGELARVLTVGIAEISKKTSEYYGKRIIYVLETEDGRRFLMDEEAISSGAHLSPLAGKKVIITDHTAIIQNNVSLSDRLGFPLSINTPYLLDVGIGQKGIVLAAGPYNERSADDQGYIDDTLVIETENGVLCMMDAIGVSFLKDDNIEDLSRSNPSYIEFNNLEISPIISKDNCQNIRDMSDNELTSFLAYFKELIMSKGNQPLGKLVSSVLGED